MKILLILFCLHLFIPLSNSIYNFITFSVNTEESEKLYSIPILSELKGLYKTPYFEPYTIFSGLNTGYGFYGGNVATNKFFLIELYDKENCLIKNVDFSKIFKTSNGFSRFQTFPSKTYHFIVENDKLRDKLEKTDLETKKLLEVREKYLDKVLNYINKVAIVGVANVKYYNVKLITIVPPENLLQQKNQTNHNIYVIKDLRFHK